MKGGESDFPIYPLHYLILCSSATDRWESQIHCPSYQIKLSKEEDLVIVTVFWVEHVDAVLENNNRKRPDACYLGTRELLPRIRARLNREWGRDRVILTPS